MKATLTVAQELLRYMLQESGHDVLLECVAELLDADPSGVPLSASSFHPRPRADHTAGPSVPARPQAYLKASSTPAWPSAPGDRLH